MKLVIPTRNTDIEAKIEMIEKVLDPALNETVTIKPIHGYFEDVEFVFEGDNFMSLSDKVKKIDLGEI